MSQTYTVKQGDHLAKIAEAYGFSDYRTIWNDASNSDLKSTRQNPNVLYPGDEVFIPDKQLREESKATEQHHKFQVSTQKLQLRLSLEDLYEKPIANAHCDLVIDGQSNQLTTDSSGKIQLDISPKAESGVLTIKDPQTPYSEIQIPIRIGYIDPVTEVSGQQARLNNLGYFAAEQVGTVDDDAFRSAVEEFQCDQGLSVDGICGPNTQSKLKDAHGC